MGKNARYTDNDQTREGGAMSGDANERVWEGRGEALDDARLTLFDARAADDKGLGKIHFRVLAHVGRQNNKRGWLRVSQSELAERWACSRSSINEAFRDLVERRYLLQRTQQEAGESFCQYKISLDGEASAPRIAQSAKGGVSSPDDTPSSGLHGGSVVTGRHVCTPGGDTPVSLETTPPAAAVKATRARPSDKPTIADSPPYPPSQAATRLGEGGAKPVREGQDRLGKSSGQAGEGWASGWGHGARELMAEWRERPHRIGVADFVATFCGTLQPPKGADPLSWMRQVAGKLSCHSEPVLRELADKVIAEQHQNVAPVSKLQAWATEIADRQRREAEANAERERQARADAAAVQRLAPGVEPEASPQRRDALALRRAFVGSRMVGAADYDAAWLGDLMVLDRTGRVLKLSVGTVAAARQIGNLTAMPGALLDAARSLWPQLTNIECTTHYAAAAAKGAA